MDEQAKAALLEEKQRLLTENKSISHTVFTNNERVDAIDAELRAAQPTKTIEEILRGDA